jgi:hypothetical protein
MDDMGRGVPAISMLSFRCSIPRYPPGYCDHAVEVVEVNASGHMDKIGRLALGGLGLQVSDLSQEHVMVLTRGAPGLWALLSSSILG